MNKNKEILKLSGLLTEGSIPEEVKLHQTLICIRKAAESLKELGFSKDSTELYIIHDRLMEDFKRSGEYHKIMNREL